MGFIDKIKGLFNNKIERSYSGITSLPTLNSTEWSESKYLQTYDTSLDVFACVRKIATKISDIEFKLYRIKNSKGDLEQILSHPILDLLYAPNPYMGKGKLIKLKVINELLTGDAYWYKVLIGNKVAELWNLRPDWMTVVPSATDYVKEFIYKIPNQKEIKFDPEEIIHFAEPSPLKEFSDRTGQSPIRPAQTRVDTEEYATKFQRDFFLNNARLDAVLTSEQPLTENQINEIRNQWSKKYKGVGKNSKIGILESGLKYEQISTAQKDMDYINGIKANRDDIFMAFEMPKAVIGIAEDVNRANAEAAMSMFLSENIKPKMGDFVEMLNQFLVPHFGKGLVLDCVDPSPENVDQKLAIYKNATECGWMTQNEIRELEGLESLPNGDEPLATQKLSTMVGLSGTIPHKKTILLKQPVKESIFEGREKLLREIKIKELGNKLNKQYKEAPKKDERKYRIWKAYVDDVEKRKDILLKSVRSFLKGQEKRLFDAIDEKEYKYEANYIKHIKKAINDKIDWEDETERLIAAITPAEEKILKLSGKAALARVGVTKPFASEALISTWLKNHVKNNSALINETTRKKITKQYYEALDKGESINEIKERIKGVYQIRGDKEAIRIARTETGSIVNEATVEAYNQTEVVKKKEWIATMDDRVRPSHAAADGQIVEKDKPFLVGGELKNAPNDINCRCAVAPVVED
jgi:HK97 family phage portal protein